MNEMKKWLLVNASLIFLAFAIPSAAQVAYTANPAPNVPTPESVLGHRP